MANSSSDKFSITQLPDDPSQIVSLTIIEPNDTGWTAPLVLHYRQVGKYYSDFWFSSGTSIGKLVQIDDSVNPSLSIIDDSANRIAALLGITINTTYATKYENNGNGLNYNPGTTRWNVSGNNNYGVILVGLMAN